MWHVVGQLLDIGETKYYGHGTDMLAINVSDTLLAALRRGLSLPGKGKTTHLLALSKTPPYRGQTRIAHGGREFVCLALERN